MTAAATRFVTPMTFEALSRHPVFHDQWALGSERRHPAHLAGRRGGPPARRARHREHPRQVRARASRTTRSARSTSRRARRWSWRPAMNVNMFEHPAVQENLAILRARGVGVVEPGSGYLACGWLGKGRLAETGEIVDAAMAVLRPPARPRGRDGARDRRARRSRTSTRCASSRTARRGKMGYRLAEAARDRGRDGRPRLRADEPRRRRPASRCVPRALGRGDAARGGRARGRRPRW